VTVDLQQRMQSLTQQILSRTRLVRIIDNLRLYGKQPDQVASDELIQRMRKDITIELIKANGQELSAFKVAYSAPSGALAQKVTGEITSLFIDENLKNQQESSAQTTAFLQNQLDEARKDLEHQEQTLGQFRSRYLGELPEQLTSNVQILGGLQARLQAATTGLHQAEQQKLYLTSLVGQTRNARPKSSDDEGSAPSAAQSSPLDEQIERATSELADLSARYTPQHPDVVRKKEQLAGLERIKRQLDSDTKPGKKPSDSATNRSGNQTAISPIAQLESQLKAVELEIVNRKQEIKTLENEIDRLQDRLNMTPVREQQLADITRNHAQSRTNYESLLQKKLQSEMATDLAKRQEGEQFRIIDPPSLPQRPYWPNPLELSLVGLAAGMFVSLAVIMLKEAVDVRIYREEDLRDWLPVPVIATIPPLPTKQEQRKRIQLRRVEILVGAGMAALVPAITFLAYLRH
jgi:polysaccharide chain length determinant protein (PEP-CTERM system associated)